MELDWLCNRLRSDQLISSAASKHYVCRWVRKRSEGWRLIESPKACLQRAQRMILEGILDHIPVHPLACGFTKGRNVIDFVKPHVNRSVCMRLDIADFFTRITISRVFGLFRVAGYNPTVSHCLAALTTTYTDPRLFDDLAHRSGHGGPDRVLYGSRHLPQGAATSPAIANLCAHRLDLRMSGLARHVGGVHYTRYADDLLFSGNRNFGRQAKRLATVAGAIAADEGFDLNFRKTRIMNRHQRQKAGGIVINQKMNIDRAEYDQLKATLFNCKKYGARSQNRMNHPHFRQHLLGKINWLATVNRGRAAKLQAMFSEIDFST